MLARFEQFLEGLIPVRKGMKILVATSGGVDSMVLTDLCLRKGIHIGLAHCNYQLRGMESDLDQQFIEHFGEERGLDVHIRSFDSMDQMAGYGVSVQMAARELRYGWFDELLDAHGYDYVATAHHRNDTVETILLNLVRGTGISGLTGIPVKRDKVIRPMMFATREEILQYAQSEGLQWREDQSNQDNKYRRNLLRNEVIPLLKEINPELEEAMYRSASNLRQVRQVFDQWMEVIDKKALTVKGEDIIIDLSAIKSSQQETYLSHRLLSYGFNASQLADILKSLTRTGRTFQTPQYQLNVDRSRLLITPHSDEAEDYLYDELPVEIQTRFYDIKLEVKQCQGYKISSDPDRAALDYDTIRLPIRIRNWQEGDSFQPLGMRGTKKISDFMIDRKIPLNLKGRQLLLFSEDEVAWVMGQQISDQFKITDRTKQVLEIKMHPHV